VEIPSLWAFCAHVKPSIRVMLGSMGFLANSVVALGATGVGSLAYGLVEAQAFKVRELDLELLPAGSESIRVLHISDLHITRSPSRGRGYERIDGSAWCICIRQQRLLRANS